MNSILKTLKRRIFGTTDASTKPTRPVSKRPASKKKPLPYKEPTHKVEDNEAGNEEGLEAGPDPDNNVIHDIDILNSKGIHQFEHLNMEDKSRGLDDGVHCNKESSVDMDISKADITGITGVEELDEEHILDVEDISKAGSAGIEDLPKADKSVVAYTTRDGRSKYLHKQDMSETVDRQSQGRLPIYTQVYTSGDVAPFELATSKVLNLPTTNNVKIEDHPKQGSLDDFSEEGTPEVVDLSKAEPHWREGSVSDGWERTTLKVDRFKEPSKIQMTQKHETNSQLYSEDLYRGTYQRSMSSIQELDDRQSDGPPVLSRTHAEKITAIIIDNYLDTGDFQAAVSGVREFNTVNHQGVISHSMNHVLERSSVARKKTGHLLHDLVYEDIISVDSFTNGLVELLDNAEHMEMLEYIQDMESNTLQIWQHYGQLISPIFQDDTVPLSILKKACRSLMVNNKAGILMAEVIKDACNAEDQEKVEYLWRSSGLKWSDFLPAEHIDQFLSNNNLEFTKVDESDQGHNHTTSENQADPTREFDEITFSGSPSLLIHRAKDPWKPSRLTETVEDDPNTEETDSTPSNKSPVLEKENAESVTKPAEPAREATPPEKEPSPSNETIPTVEINELEKEAEEELEEGEIRDDVDEDDPEAMLRYKYLEDPWSPLNPEGKKHYDREFLLQFQFKDTATSKPAGLPDIPDINLDKPLSTGRQFSRELQSNAGSQNFIDFTPNYVCPAGGQGGRQRSRGLSRAKELSKPDKKTEELYKKTRSILNKLTPQKFQTLVTQMQSLPIDSENKLKGVIDIIFEKAIGESGLSAAYMCSGRFMVVREPNYSVAYANMCRCLSMFKVPSETKPGEMVNFRAVLLTRCQREFEKDKSSEAHFIKLREELENAEEDKKAELRAELEYQEMVAKRRSLGNIVFIGALFNLKMLTENIMHDCVFKLLRTKDSENLECLCRLLTTIGKKLDTEKAKNRVNQYFQQMSKIVHDKKSPMTSRLKFMLQDVMELRLSKWVPRRVDNNPKTIDQIHKEVQQEAQAKALASQQAQFNKPARGSGGGGGGRRGPPEQRGGMGSDGWNTVSRTPLKVDRSIDPSKMKFSKQNTDETSIQLGQGGGASRFAGWGRGSTGGSMGRSSMEEKTPSTPANRVSALSKPEENSSRRYCGSSPARGEGRGRGFRPPSLNARRYQESDWERAVAVAKAIGSRNTVDGGIERERESRSRVEAPRPAGPAEISKDDMEKKTTAILDEYLHIQDMKEAVMCVKELNTANHLHFVLHSIKNVLERSNVARKQTGHLLHDLVNQQIISADSYINGLVEALEFAEDLEIDIPMIWKYYGELISPMIQDGSVPLSFLKKACKPLMASNKAGKLLAEVLKDASHREGHKKVGGLWTDSGLQWSDFIPKNQVEQFLTDNKLEFIKGGDSVPTTPTTGLPLLQIAEKLEELIVDQHKDNETVIDWIESNVDEPTTKKPKFIRALMTAVCKSAIKGDAGKEKVEQKEIAGRNDLLQKYLDHQPDSELQALYAIQALVTKLEHPQGMLRVMFDTLYDDDIISEDAFIQWEKSEEETEGKGAALRQVVQFFTWLREAEDDS